MRKIIVLIIIILIFIIGCNGYDKTDEDASNKFDKICIDGHIYYQRKIGYAGYLAIKLNDNGIPVKCEGKK